jgi:hypothetical protein
MHVQLMRSFLMHAQLRRRPAAASLRLALAAVFFWLAIFHGMLAAHTPGAHVHGEATLNVVADGAQLEIQLLAPLDSVLGFEHAPRTDTQREAVRAMAARMRQAQRLFATTPQAGCSATSVRLVSASLPAQLLGETAAPSRQLGQGASGHDDLEASFVFRCASPDRLRGFDSSLQMAFPGIRTLKVRVVSARGQQSVVLSRGRTSVQW